MVDHRATTTGKLLALKAEFVKLSKEPLDLMYIIALGGIICDRVLLKDYAVCKKWITK